MSGGIAPLFMTTYIKAGQKNLINFINNRPDKYRAFPSTELYDLLAAEPATDDVVFRDSICRMVICTFVEVYDRAKTSLQFS